MNKKFSTLVAALLVSGAGYAVVSTFNAYPLANSPIVKAATANLNVSTRSAASTGTVTPVPYNAEQQVWMVEINGASCKLKTKDGNYLALDGENLVMSGTTTLSFTLESDGTIKSSSDWLLIRNDQLVLKSDIAVGDTKVALFDGPEATNVKATLDALSQTATYFLGTFVKVFDEIASTTQNAINVADPMTVKMDMTGNFTAGAVMDQTPTAVKVVETAAGSGHYVLQVQLGDGKVPMYAKWDGSTATLTYVSDITKLDAYSYLTLDGTNAKQVKIGNTYLLITSSELQTGGQSDVNGIFFYKNGENDLTAWTDIAAVATEADPVYLINTAKGTATNISAQGGYVCKFAATPGSVTFATISSIDNVEATKQLTINADGSISDGLFFMTAASPATGQNVTLDLTNAALSKFTLDADGAIMLKYASQATAPLYLYNSGGLQIAYGATAAPANRHYLYKMNGNGVLGTPLTTWPEDGGKYVIALATSHTDDLSNQKVIEVTPITPDTPTGDAYNLTANANYYIADQGATNFLTYSTSTVDSKTVYSLDNTTTKSNKSMWTVSKFGGNGVATYYSFANRADASVKLAFEGKYDKDAGTWEVKMNPAGEYNKFFVDSDGKISFNIEAKDADGKVIAASKKTYVLDLTGVKWSVKETPSDGSAISAFKFVEASQTTIGTIDETIAYLNKTAGFGNGFAISFADKAGEAITVEDNSTFSAGSIVAVKGPKSFAITKSAPTEDLSKNLYLKVSGNYPLTAATATDKDQLEAFRSSKFIVVDTVLYSDLIKDENDFYYYTVAEGNSFVSADGQIAKNNSNATTELERYKKDGDLEGVTRRAENAVFTVKQLEGATISDPLQLTVKASFPKANNKVGLTDYITDQTVSVAVKEFNKNYYVGASKNIAHYAYMYFGTNNDVTYKQVYGIVNIYNAKYDSKGEVYANTATGIDKLDPKYITVNTNAPEGQFLVNYANNKFTFINRESGVKAFGDSYGLKTVKDAKGNVIKDVYAVANGDTVKIVLALPETIYDGYKNFDQKKYELTDSVYTMSFLPKVDGKEGLDRVYVAENHDTDHMLTLTTDNADAAKFSMVKFEAKADTVYVSTGKYITSDGKLVDDKAVAFAYTIYNDDNDEYVEYNNAVSKEYFFCNWNKKVNEEPLKQTAQRYILKEKGNNNYQLIAISYKEGDSKAFNDLKDAKAYGAFQAPKVSQEANIYKVTDNDIINISVIGAPMYRTVEAAPFDTIRIYKEGSKNVALYAKTAEQEIVSGSNWLAMGHSADVNTAVTKFSMFVDTAYVRANTNKPQYMLVIEADTVHGKYACGVPGHDLHDSGKIDTVYGKYLTTMIDSIPAWGNKHSNPYYWEDTKYPRLGFVNAKHFGDSLVILNDNGIQHANDTINLNDNSNKFGVYAFRIVNDDTKSFNIETAYDRKADGSFTTGWIKWLNGVPVVAPNDEKDKAEIFSLEATSNDPVANETIGTSTISVVAGNGTVTIKGAAGKKVAISNVLGQAIANTVLSSDNATISAPAGIVVVAVEGEAAVKAIVK